MVQARRGHLAALQGVDQASVSCSWARAVLRNTTPSRIAANCPAPIIPTVSSVTGACRETMSACEQFVEAVAGLVVVRVVGDDRDAQSGQPPSQRPADGAETHQAGRPAGDLTAAEALVGDRSVAKHLAGPTSASAGSKWRVAANSSATAISATASALRPGVCRTRESRRWRRRCRRCSGHRAWMRRPQRELEHRSAHRIGFHHKDICALCSGAVGQLLGGVDAQRGLVDPRVVDHVGQPAQLVEPRPGSGAVTRARGLGVTNAHAGVR